MIMKSSFRIKLYTHPCTLKQKHTSTQLLHIFMYSIVLLIYIQICTSVSVCFIYDQNKIKIFIYPCKNASLFINIQNVCI